MVTENQEVIYVNDGGTIALPRYEFDAVYGSEAVTTSLARQMEKCMGYKGMDGKISLADTKLHHEHEPREKVFAGPYDDEDDDNDDDIFEDLLYGIDPKKTPAELAIKNDSPFRVCVAYDCVPCEKEAEDRTTAPFVRWARERFIYQPFPEWDAERKACMAHEKKILRMPVERWDDMIMSHEITDRISVMATKIAQEWIVKIKPPSFAHKT